MANLFVRFLGRSIIKFSGWKVDQHLKEDFKRCVMIGAPHTSNWDFPITMAAFEVMEIPLRFTIKKEWMRPPLGWIMKGLGAIPIDRSPKDARSQPLSTVDAMVRLFENQKELAVLVTPEGSRSLKENWRTGFYHVAKQAGVPIALGYLDWGKKTAGIGKVIWPSDDMEKDMQTIMRFYQGIQPRFPEKFSVDVRYLPQETAAPG